MAEGRPAPEEFEEARRRELARLNLRISSMMGRTLHTLEEAEILEGDGAERRWAYMAAVRRRGGHTPEDGRAPRPPG